MPKPITTVTFYNHNDGVSFIRQSDRPPGARPDPADFDRRRRHFDRTTYASRERLTRLINRLTLDGDRLMVSGIGWTFYRRRDRS